MAQRITIVDDVDLDTEAVGSIEFGFRITGPGGKAGRQEYVIDLNAPNLEEFSETLTQWASHARKADKAPAVIRPAAPPDSAPDRGGEVREWYTPPEATTTRERERWSQMRKEARAWALANGWPHLGDRGRVPDDAYISWKKAMGWTGPIFDEWSTWRETQDAAAPPKRKPPRAKATRSTQSTLM
jgi:hypothetical protein